MIEKNETSLFVSVTSQFGSLEWFSPLYLARIGPTRDGNTVITFMDGRYIVVTDKVDSVLPEVFRVVENIKAQRPNVLPPSVTVDTGPVNHG